MDRIFLKGLPVSNGVGMGPICVFHYEDYRINYGQVDDSQIEAQINKLELSINKTINEIIRLKDDLKNSLKNDSNLIVDVYKAILGDQFFIQDIKTLIREQKIYAENAVEQSFSKVIREIEESDNDYAKQRVFDLNDIRSRVIKNIIGSVEASFKKIYHKQIVAVKELTPTLAAALGKKRVIGIIADEGAAYFSHAAIILRGLGIPAINNVNFINIKKCKDIFSIIDGRDGFLIVNPENAEIERYRSILKRNIQNRKDMIKKRKKPTVTSDGYKINIYANVGNVQEAVIAKEINADGIGLVRTEMLFFDYGVIPDEKTQFLAYLKIVKKMGSKPVVIRTVDFGGDKNLKNISTGVSQTGRDTRGIARSLIFKDEFITQIRSIIHVLKYGNISIAFPMVNSASEIKEAKSIIQRNFTDIYKSRKAPREMRIGAVIETREGIEHLDEILKEVDFISIGTNDLFEQTMGLDRVNDCAKEYEYFHPAFLKIVQKCINKAKKKGKQVAVCGEMASHPYSAAILIGMGLNDLSVAPSKIIGVKSVINKINSGETKILVKKIMRNHSPFEVKNTVCEWIQKIGSDSDV